jgi:lycopene beta-cyclase
VIDVHVPVLMDLSTPQLPRTVTFGYVLPLEPDLALVEFTVFSAASAGRWPTARYEQELRAYLARRWGCSGGQVTVEAVEDGAIPMTDAVFRSRPAKRVVRVGAAGGATRGSTGYTFAAMYRQASEIAADLRADRDPVPARAYPLRHRAIDGALLTALDDGLVEGADLFAGLWLSQPPARLLRFLDGTSSLREEWAVMATAPRLPMGRATARWFTRRTGERLSRHRGVTEL